MFVTLPIKLLLFNILLKNDPAVYDTMLLVNQFTFRNQLTVNCHIKLIL